MTLKEIAKDLGYHKINKLWFSDFYLDMLSYTPYEVGEEVYLSSGKSICEDGLTNAELKELYKEELEMRNE